MIGQVRLKTKNRSMASPNVIHVLYNDDDILMNAVKEIRANHYTIEEVYTPFPVHGLDKAMGLAPTRIAITSFIYGLIGLSVAVWMMDFIMIEDWPRNIGVSPVLPSIRTCRHSYPLCLSLLYFCSSPDGDHILYA